MDIESIRAYCLAKKATTEGCPFGEDVLVIYVLGKIFVMMDVVGVPLSMNLKCDPERALELREQYAAVAPGYHTSKKHWNLVTVDGSIPEREVLAMIDHSYEMVVKGMKKSDREQLAAMT